MRNLLKQAERQLRQWRNEWLVEPVVYWRGSTRIGPIPATQGSTTSEVEQGDIILQSKSVDWIIDANNLGFVEPEPGDFIESGLGDDVTRYFEVAALSGEAAWRWHGTDALSYRIHTRQTNDAALLDALNLGGGHFGLHFGATFGRHFGGQWP